MHITGTDLLNLGFPEGKAVGAALQILKANPGKLEAILTDFRNLITDPERFKGYEQYKDLVAALIEKQDADYIALRDMPLGYEIYGEDGIEQGALDQMQKAMTLPVAVGGALMADAHQGYGLPIGGVLATENSIIPYAVGVDIGCRMSLSVYDIPISRIDQDRDQLKKILTSNTKFGIAAFKYPKDHSVLESPLFKEIKVAKQLKDKAAKQIGTSGGGNHFVEFGIVEITDAENEFGLNPGKYMALLSHSGSRGFGAQIANHYTKLARKLCKLPHEVRHLAWLDLDTEEGQEYWQAMSLAGAYASACHEQIHDRMAIGLRTNPIMRVENHHNFAWKEIQPNGSEWIVHRKGATPASKGALGIIPGSQTAPGFIIRGKGEKLSLSSASHGAGRLMSRTQAKKTLDPVAVTALLKEAGVEVLGSGLDEAPMAYKDIHQVMAAQLDLVEVLGTFHPKIVRMCGDKFFKAVD